MIQVNYIVNKDFYASVLCVQKEVKNNTCQGQCHLKKELEQIDVSTTSNESEESNKNSNTNEKLNWISLALKTTGFINCNIEINFNIQHSYATLNGFSKSLFSPPELV